VAVRAAGGRRESYGAHCVGGSSSAPPRLLARGRSGPQSALEREHQPRLESRSSPRRTAVRCRCRRASDGADHHIKSIRSRLDKDRSLQGEVPVHAHQRSGVGRPFPCARVGRLLRATAEAHATDPSRRRGSFAWPTALHYRTRPRTPGALGRPQLRAPATIRAGGDRLRSDAGGAQLPHGARHEEQPARARVARVLSEADAGLPRRPADQRVPDDFGGEREPR